MAKRIPIDSGFWIVLPKKRTASEVSLYNINAYALATTADEAWHKFLHPSLNKDAYEEDGFEAVQVNILIEII